MSETRALYRQILRHSARFSGYNFREYALRRARDGFRSNMNAEPETAAKLLEEARQTLAVVSRQSTISQMYRTPELVVERQAPVA